MFDETPGSTRDRLPFVTWQRFGSVVALVLAGLLSGCTAIPLDRLRPPTGSATSCETSKRLLQSRAAEPSFVFVVPRAATVPSGKELRSGGETSSRGVERFRDFVAGVGATKRHLPQALQDDDVTNALFSVMVKTSAEAQIAVAKASGVRNATTDEAEVAAYPVPARLTHRQLKNFAKKLFDLQLRPTLEASPTRRAPAGDDAGKAFAKYFIAYYEGKFVDRLGESIKKPSALSSLAIPINLTIPNADIASALTVLLEYMIDLFDPTPVMGDTDAPGETTKFYPGGKAANRPTAFVADLAEYRKIPEQGCGVTTKNVVILATLAHAAADGAAGVGGLVSGSFGGAGVSFGAFGKLSIGDNQTLATIVKTAASRGAARATFAGSYWALQGLPSEGGSKAVGQGGAEDFLTFPR